MFQLTILDKIYRFLSFQMLFQNSMRENHEATWKTVWRILERIPKENKEEPEIIWSTLHTNASIKAAATYNPKKGTTFFTHFCWKLRGEQTLYVREIYKQYHRSLELSTEEILNEEDQYLEGDLGSDLYGLLEEMPPIVRDCVERYYGLNGHEAKNQWDVSRDLNIGRTTVRRKIQYFIDKAEGRVCF